MMVHGPVMKMTLRVYNTLTREMEEFRPEKEGRIDMYVCGPTVYDDCHLGHARSYVSFDVIRRYLEYKGYDVNYMSNLTDMDDKIINRARETGDDPIELSERYSRSFFDDMEALGVRPADVNPKVTDHIREIVEMVEGLVERGYGYVTERGNVYFDLRKAENKIGVLSHQRLDDLLEGSGSRVKTEEDKRFPLDFSLWKASDDDEPGWDSPWGRGRPGWHIECSVMSMKYGGDQLDIHGGGMDLIFPHHEAEILQSESYTGVEPFSRYWLHNGFLTIDEDKMSKSLGNFFTIKEVLEKHDPKTIRFFILNTHYRRPIDFSDKHLEESARAHGRIVNTIANARAALQGQATTAKEGEHGGGLHEAVAEARRSFERSMDDDFNTREALAGVFVLARKVNEALSEGKPSREGLQEVLDFFVDIGQVFGMFSEEARGKGETSVEGPSDEEVEALLKEREEARDEKDWDRADAIRDRLDDMGILVEDGKDGVRWRRK